MLVRARAVHDLLLERAVAEASKRATPAEAALAGESALEAQRRIKVLREQLKYEQELGLWIRREDLRKGLAVFASVIRSAGETLQRDFGEEAHGILDEALTDAADRLAETFRDEHDGPIGEPDA